MAHFLLSFVVLLRIFQTYVVAALDYTDWHASFIDVFLIFFIGALEYFVFSSLEIKTFSVYRYHATLSVLSGVGLVGYFFAVLRIKEEMFESFDKYSSEVRLQLHNLGGLLSVLLISVFVFLSPRVWTDETYTVLALIGSGILIYNIYYSLTRSFANLPGQPTPVSTLDHGSISAEAGQDEDIEIVVQPAERKDLMPLLSILMEQVPMRFMAMFDTSPRLTRQILARILPVNGGKSFLGYRSYQVAFASSTGACVGVVSLDLGEQGGVAQRASVGVRIGLILLRYLGIVGLLRSLGNFRSIQKSESETKAQEVRIKLIAVDRERMHVGIGGQLIDFAKGVARSHGKSMIVADAFSGSVAAQFFEHEGFRRASVRELTSDEGKVELARFELAL